jgi:L(+)-tartrate dehydratase beta subunit
MKEKTAAACKAFGAIHCVFPAGNAVVGASCVEEITAVHWLDLGAPEAVWCCRVKEFGPLIVTIDQNGRNYFEEKRAEYEQRKEEQIEEISRQVHFMK